MAKTAIQRGQPEMARKHNVLNLSSGEVAKV